MALSNDEKKLIRAQVAAYLGDIKNVKCVQDAKPDAQEYFAFIATRLVKKLRLDTGKVEGDPVATKAPAVEPAPKVLNAMDLRPDLKAAKKAVAEAKPEDKPAVTVTHVPADKPAAAKRKPAVRTKAPVSQAA